MPSLIIPLGSTGLVKADLDMRFYRGDEPSPEDVVPLELVELTQRQYRVENLPTGPAEGAYTLTWQELGGAVGSYSYPRPDGAPEFIIVPSREAGLTVSDFFTTIYLNGELRADTITAEELGSPGDYKLAGWPTAGAPAGEWVLFWTRGFFSQFSVWQVGPLAPALSLPAASRRFADSFVRVARHFGEGMQIVLRRHHSLMNENDLPADSLTVVGDHAVDAGQVLLTSDRLEGRFPPGLRITLGAKVYTALREAEATGNEIAVLLDRGLELAVDDGDVAVLEASRDYTLNTFASARSQSVQGGRVFISETQTFAVPALDQTAAVEPRSDDFLVEGGLPGDAVAVERVAPAGVSVGWYVRRVRNQTEAA